MMFLVDSSDSVTVVGLGGFRHQVNGLSVSTMSMTRTAQGSFVSASSTERMKLLATADGSGSAMMQYDVVPTESGNYWLQGTVSRRIEPELSLNPKIYAVVEPELLRTG